MITPDLLSEAATVALNDFLDRCECQTYQELVKALSMMIVSSAVAVAGLVGEEETQRILGGIGAEIVGRGQGPEPTH